MVSRTAFLPPMSIGYQPTCLGKQGWWPCYPMMPPYSLMGLGKMPRSYSLIPRYGAAGLGLFSTDYSTWSWPEGIIIAGAGLVLTYLLYAGVMQSKQTVYRGQAAGRKRRVEKAKRLRAKAKKLEEGEGRLFGLI